MVVGKASRHFAVLYVTIAPEEHLVALYLDQRFALGRCRRSQHERISIECDGNTSEHSHSYSANGFSISELANLHS